ncbi:unnamed protein product [Boreogadus saida]
MAARLHLDLPGSPAAPLPPEALTGGGTAAWTRWSGPSELESRGRSSERPDHRAFLAVFHRKRCINTRWLNAHGHYMRAVPLPGAHLPPLPGGHGDPSGGPGVSSVRPFVWRQGEEQCQEFHTLLLNCAEDRGEDWEQDNKTGSRKTRLGPLLPDWDQRNQDNQTGPVQLD